MRGEHINFIITSNVHILTELEYILMIIKQAKLTAEAGA